MRGVSGSRTPICPDPKAVLAQWNEHAERYRGFGRGAGQELIEKPYVLQSRFHGNPLNFLIASVSGQGWYDNLFLLADLEWVSHFGMIRPGDVVFDLGAHQGYYSVIFQKMVGPAGRVYAFEPFAVNADIVRFNSLLNHADIEVFNVGIGKQRETLKASVAHESIGIMNTPDAVDVTIDVLDSYAHLQPNFVKIDIEGAEIDALASASKILDQRPNMLIEVHTSFLEKFGRRVQDLFDILPLHDYVCYVIYPGLPFAPLDRNYPFKEHFAIFLMKDHPLKRIYL